MNTKEVTLSEFMDFSTVINNGDGTFGVEIILKDMTKTILVVNKCNNEYDAKERAFLYLSELINKNKLI